jgi:hypothetical protein
MRFTGQKYFRGLIILLSLLTLAIFVGCGGGGGGGGGGSDDNTQNNQDASVVGPEGGEVPLSSGGSIVIPEGAFTENTKINVTSTLSPVLPDGVEAVGKALSISAATQPSQPVTLRVPIPESVSDPENLVVIRVESDSTTTFLMTEVVGDEIVAASPGFSKFITGYFSEAKLKKGQKNIWGEGSLLYGEHSEYNITRKIVDIGKTIWKVDGSATLLSYGDTYAIIKAGEFEGKAKLSCEYIDVEHGIKWFGVKEIDIEEISWNGLYCSIITRGNEFYPNEEIHMTSEVYGPVKMPLSLMWDFGDGEEGNTSTEVKRYDLPSKSYASVKIYQVRLQIRDSENWGGSCIRNIEVIEEPLSVKVDGPSSITGWSHPGSLVEYTATASGGEAPFLYAWLLNPSNDNRIVPDVNTSKENFFFDQPGQFSLEVTANDVPGDSTKTVIPIVVKGGESLSTRFIDIPTTAKPNESVRADISIRGGVLVASGKKAGYTLEVNWGDDSGTITEENVGKINTPYDGTLVYQNHTYTEDGTYTVTVNAYDAAGNHDWTAQDIEITASEATPAYPLRYAGQGTTTESIHEHPLYDNVSCFTMAQWEITLSAGGTLSGNYLATDPQIPGGGECKASTHGEHRIYFTGTHSDGHFEISSGNLYYDETSHVFREHGTVIQGEYDADGIYTSPNYRYVDDFWSWLDILEHSFNLPRVQ